MLRLKRILINSAIGVKGYAQLMEISEKALHNKLSGVVGFSYNEYKKLQELLPEYNVDYLLTDQPDST